MVLDLLFALNTNVKVSGIGTKASPYTLTITNICEDTKELQIRLNGLSDTTFDTYYFHDLRRVEIVKYTEKRLQKPEKCAKAQDKIIQLCRQRHFLLRHV